MSFPNVDHKELDTITVLSVQVLEAHGLSYKGLSGEAAEDQRNRLFPAKVREPNRIFTACVTKLKVRCS